MRHFDPPYNARGLLCDYCSACKLLTSVRETVSWVLTSGGALTLCLPCLKCVTTIVAKNLEEGVAT